MVKNHRNVILVSIFIPSFGKHFKSFIMYFCIFLKERDREKKKSYIDCVRYPSIKMRYPRSSVCISITSQRQAHKNSFDSGE